MPYTASYSRVFSFGFSAVALLSYPFFSASAADDKANYVTKEQLPALIKETLINDPSILTEVVEKMQESQEEEMAKQAKEGITKYKKELFSDKNSPVVGASEKDADVTIVEFFDYHCGFCKRALDNLSKVIESDKKVRVVFKEYPILSENSVLASRAALAVNRIAPDKYFDFHKALFEISGSINEASIAEEAKKLGINPAKLTSEMAHPEIQNELSQNRKLGAEIGAQGTPAFVINDGFYAGAMPHDIMTKIIADARKGKK